MGNICNNGNIEQAKDVLMGNFKTDNGVLIKSNIKKIQVKSIAPREIKHMPWRGHLGINLTPN